MLSSMTIWIFVSAFVLFVTLCIQHFNRVARMQRELDYYASAYKCRNGVTSLWSGSNGEMLTYELRSFDDGLNWYVIRRNKNNVYVQGNAENVYPGLLQHLNAMDELYRRVKENGPLNISNSDDLNCLKNAGFEINPIGTN